MTITSDVPGTDVTRRLRELVDCFASYDRQLEHDAVARDERQRIIVRAMREEIKRLAPLLSDP
jgi:hypothetical protein